MFLIKKLKKKNVITVYNYKYVKIAKNVIKDVIIFNKVNVKTKNVNFVIVILLFKILDENNIIYLDK